MELNKALDNIKVLAWQDNPFAEETEKTINTIEMACNTASMLADILGVTPEFLFNTVRANGWHPISEKPPEEEKSYWVQLDSGSMCQCRWTNANYFWNDHTAEWHWNFFDLPQYTKIVAWRELPKKYEEIDHD